MARLCGATSLDATNRTDDSSVETGDSDASNAEQFAKNQGMTWTQTYLGQWNVTPVPGMFGINGNSACVLVDSEGRLASGQLRGTAIRNTINNLFSALE